MVGIQNSAFNEIIIVCLIYSMPHSSCKKHYWVNSIKDFQNICISPYADEIPFHDWIHTTMNIKHHLFDLKGKSLV